MPNSVDNKNANQETAYLAGGCFWCLEAVFNRTEGISAVTSGYAGGKTKNPNYEQVSSGKTGHAETVKIEFDPEKISFEEILQIFFSLHDPTTPNRQGNDIGPQYRSAVFYADEKQKNSAKKIRRQIDGKKIYPHLIVTEILPLKEFYPAEEYHQKYFEKNPQAGYCQLIINPKIAKFRKKFSRYRAYAFDEKLRD